MGVKSGNTTVCSITGLPKTVDIEYYLDGVPLGRTKVSECSMSSCRIAEAKAIGIDFYDQFVLDNGRADSANVLLPYSGVLKPVNDFLQCDKILNNVNQQTRLRK